jgi:membrane fusion protein, heavy metal efflux system
LRLREREGLSMASDKTTSTVGAVSTAAAMAIAVFAYALGQLYDGWIPSVGTRASAQVGTRSETTTDSVSVNLSDSQLASVKVAPVSEREFPVEKQAVGSIDFNQDMTLQVFTPYQGRILALFAKVGDDVKKGQTLFTIDSPDLLQAESTLIAAAGVLDFTTRNLARLRAPVRQDRSRDRPHHRAARGRSDAGDPEPAQRADHRAQCGARFVRAAGQSAGALLGGRHRHNVDAGQRAGDRQPGVPLGAGGQGHGGGISGPGVRRTNHHVGAIVDPNTRRVLIRSEVKDPQHELRSGMFANFVIRTGDPVRSPAVPLDGVVREGDGTMTVWVTADRRRFTRRTVKIGLQHEGYRQILEGVAVGELVATEGALFLSNTLTAATQ